MKVRELLQNIDQVIAILQHYQEWTLDEMLKDIYIRCCTGEQVVPVGRKHRTKGLYGWARDLPVPEKALDYLGDLNYAEQAAFLDLYYEKSLKIIAEGLGISLPKAKKSMLVDIILENMHGPTVLRLPISIGENDSKLTEMIRDEKMEDIIAQIRQMDRDELLAKLNKYKAKEVQQIARCLNLSMPGSNNKSDLIYLIANHMGYLKKHSEMLARHRG